MSLFSLEWWQIALLFLPALRRLGVISINTAIEADLYACVFVPVLGGVAYVLFGWRRAH